MKPQRIILDLDDVLNTLSLDLLRFDGLDFPSYDAIGEWTWGYDIIQATADMSGNDRMSVVEYWERIPRELWSNTRLSPEFNEIIDFCDEKVGLKNVLIGTSPTKCAECCAGKLEWIEKNLSKTLQRQWAITPRKNWLSAPDSVLIDDLEDNCRLFSHRGGSFILVSRPWNRFNKVPVMEAINDQWEQILRNTKCGATYENKIAC